MKREEWGPEWLRRGCSACTGANWGLPSVGGVLLAPVQIGGFLASGVFCLHR
jgi:hypothetical protein